MTPIWRDTNNKIRWGCRVLTAASVAVLLCVTFEGDVSVAQKRLRRPNISNSTRGRATDYSKFSHATTKHQGACNTCHKIPSTNWQKVSNIPDVTDYPAHNACVGCHRSQFFKGAKPVICSDCHTRTSPRDEVRFEFRNPTTRHQFMSVFPHDKHQDVIAKLLPPPLARWNQAFFIRTNFDAPPDEQVYNNCSICHGPRVVGLKAPTGGWVDSFIPTTASFKSAPTDHSSCFNCHWKSQQPIANNCVGCHKLVEPYLPSDVPVRISLKFEHEGGGAKKNHVSECTTCHINITKSASLRGLKPDVPITSCTECHNKDGLRQDVSKELAAIDKNQDFVCVYCHTSNVGKIDPPPSHYLIAERPPKKRK